MNSATYGTNCDKLVDVITNKVNQIMGKKIFQLETSPETHSERLRWLYRYVERHEYNLN